MNDLTLLKVGAKALAVTFAEKVAPIYKLLNWKWVGTEYGVPSEDEIAEFTRGLIDSLGDGDRSTCSGGIVVEKEFDWLDSDEGTLIGLNIRMEIENTVWLSELK